MYAVFTGFDYYFYASVFERGILTSFSHFLCFLTRQHYTTVSFRNSFWSFLLIYRSSITVPFRLRISTLCVSSRVLHDTGAFYIAFSSIRSLTFLFFLVVLSLSHVRGKCRRCIHRTFCHGNWPSVFYRYLVLCCNSPFFICAFLQRQLQRFLLRYVFSTVVLRV